MKNTHNTNQDQARRVPVIELEATPLEEIRFNDTLFLPEQDNHYAYGYWSMMGEEQ